LCQNWKKCSILSGGVGIGGVLEPLSRRLQVIIEDNAFIGQRCIVVEGGSREKEAVFGCQFVVLTASTKNYRMLLETNR